ncbi:hypothetical protein [Flavobacterium pedocola]
MTKFIVLGLLASMISCKNNEQVYTKEQGKSTSAEMKTVEDKKIQTETTPALQDDCDLLKFLNDPKTPKLAKALFENKAKNDDAALAYFEKLKSSDTNERSFYFKVITNSYNIADGAYAEGLGYSGLNYVETNTLDFIAYFENKKCFTDNDLKTWSKIVLLEFSLQFENENDRNIVNTFVSKLNQKCADCNASQKETLRKFNHYLTEAWNN